MPSNTIVAGHMAPSTDARQPRARRAKRPNFRRDIEGLRALAIILVLLDHAIGWPLGGFIGVDVFFVISGFLITGLLLKEHRQTGRISFADFYRRRARRILPASVFVLSVTVGVSWFVYFSTRFQQIAVDGVWTLFFGANWRFAAEGTDYFAANQDPSPLQHYWSLAVEEQFYFVWPLILVTLLTLAVRLKWTRRVTLALGAIVLVLIAVGFVYSVDRSILSPTIAYFSTFTRAWELLAGALIAVVAPVFTRLPEWTRAPLAWTGFLSICAGAFLIVPTSTFPGPWGLVPVLGTMAVIAAGTGTNSASTLFPLTNPVAGYVGRISYSLYLWHWPVIILLSSILVGERRAYKLLAIVIALALSVISFHLIEDPIRRSSWLMPKAQRHKMQARPRPKAPKVLVLGATAALVIAGGTGFVLDRTATPLAAAPAPTHSVIPLPASGPLRDVRAGVESALTATQWPSTLTPSLEAVGESAPPELTQDCVNDWNSMQKSCTYGSATAPKTVMVMGDSTSIAWLPGIRTAFPANNWRIVSYGKYGCPAAVITVRGPDQQPSQGCDDHREWVLSQVSKLKPDVIVMGDAEGYVDSLPSGATSSKATTDWRNALLQTLQRASVTHSKIYVLSSPPAAPNLAQCATKGSTPAACVTSIAPAWHRTSQAEIAAVVKAKAERLDVAYVDTHLWVCGQDDRCPAFANDMIVRSDVNHFTNVYSASLGPLLAENFAAALLPETSTAGGK